jgi:hypothetical protein
MTRYLTTRTHDTGGSVHYPKAVDCDWRAASLTYKPVDDAKVVADAGNKHLVFAIHGFNVPRPHGVTSLGRLEAELALPPDFAFFGVLWPGDFWLPVVDYPFEAAHAVTAGQKLARYIDDHFAAAGSINFISHSLGGRVLLQAVQDVGRPVNQVCVTAGAVDNDCFVAQYRKAEVNAARTAVLSSLQDKVLQLAYPAGDFIADVFLGDNDSPWRAALGRAGPPNPVLAPLIEQPIPDNAGFDGKGFDHGDYFPPSEAPKSPPADPKWKHAVAYMRRIVTGGGSYWA